MTLNPEHHTMHLKLKTLHSKRETHNQGAQLGAGFATQTWVHMRRQVEEKFRS